MRKIFYFIATIILLFIAINLCIASEIDYSTDTLKNYCKQHSLSQNYTVLVDFSKHSGTYRFFVIDLNKNEIVAKSLCAHGSGSSTASTPTFSNKIGSNSSCLGHFKITSKSKMKSRDMDCFKLKGMDSTNSNAEVRGILIHTSIVNNICKYGIYPFYLPIHKLISSGCFAIDSDTMETIDELLKQESKPILLYAYYT